MRPPALNPLFSFGPWAGSCLIHAGLLSALLVEGVHQMRVSSALPAGKVALNVPARVTTRPPAPVKAKPSTTVTSPDGKVSLPDVAKEASPAESAPSESRGGGDASEVTLKERYLFGFRSRIEQKKTYPAMAKRLGETGRVVISLTLMRDGSITNVTVKASSSFDRLDRAALETVKAVERYEPMPSEIPGELIAVEVPIEYAL